MEWSECLAVVWKVSGLSPARAKEVKTLTVHPAVNRQQKERIEPRLSHPTAPMAIRLRAPLPLPFKRKEFEFHYTVNDFNLHLFIQNYGR